jgi:hypothetical protein
MATPIAQSGDYYDSIPGNGVPTCRSARRSGRALEDERCECAHSGSAHGNVNTAFRLVQAAVAPTWAGDRLWGMSSQTALRRRSIQSGT